MSEADKLAAAILRQLDWRENGLRLKQQKRLDAMIRKQKGVPVWTSKTPLKN